MSRQTKYELIFPKGIKCNIGLQKSYESKTVFCQGKEGRKVRTLKALTVDDATPESIEDVESLVKCGELDSYYTYRDETGETELIPIDKKALQSLFINTSSMRVLGTISMSDVRPHMLDNAHYFIQCQRDGKSKTVNAADQKVYTIIYHYLNEQALYLLVKFISSNREKYALIYADPESAGLRMTIMIHSTYQRTRREADSHLLEIEGALAYGRKLFGGMALRSIDPETIVDDYEDKVRNYIEEYMEAKRSGKKLTYKPKLKLKPKSTEVDVLDLIMAL